MSINNLNDIDQSLTGIAGINSFNYTGIYSPQTVYFKGDVVYDDGSTQDPQNPTGTGSFICLVDGINGTPTQDQDSWGIVAINANSVVINNGGTSTSITNVVNAYTYKGPFNSNNGYNYNDIVTYNGSSYLNLATGGSPPHTDIPSFSINWGYLALQGDKGKQGDPGTAFAISYTYKGIWNPAAAYFQADVIVSNQAGDGYGNGYICLVDNVNLNPKNYPSAWGLISLGGIAGTNATNTYTTYYTTVYENSGNSDSGGGGGGGGDAVGGVALGIASAAAAGLAALTLVVTGHTATLATYGFNLGALNTATDTLSSEMDMVNQRTEWMSSDLNPRTTFNSDVRISNEGTKQHEFQQNGVYINYNSLSIRDPGEPNDDQIYMDNTGLAIIPQLRTQQIEVDNSNQLNRKTLEILSNRSAIADFSNVISIGKSGATVPDEIALNGLINTPIILVNAGQINTDGPIHGQGFFVTDIIDTAHNYFSVDDTGLVNASGIQLIDVTRDVTTHNYMEFFEIFAATGLKMKSLVAAGSPDIFSVNPTGAVACTSLNTSSINPLGYSQNINYLSNTGNSIINLGTNSVGQGAGQNKNVINIGTTYDNIYIGGSLISNGGGALPLHINSNQTINQYF